MRIDNQIWVRIEPGLPVTFDEAMKRLAVLLRFITVATGRRQSMRRFFIEIGEGESSSVLEVFWSHYPKRPRDAGHSGRGPQPRDLPLDAIRHPEEFRTVLTQWLALDADRRAARGRMDDCFVLQSSYSVDRLTGAANAFDLLRPPAVPERVELCDAVQAAAKLCKDAFRPLPESEERQDLFDAIRRLGRANLKRKVRHRAQIILKATGAGYFRDLEFACDRAVDARNHYVHGSPVKFDPEPPGVFGFLTDTLEFVFTASELIESGWDITRTLKAGTTMTHPFGTYAVTYRENLEFLRANIKAARGVEEE